MLPSHSTAPLLTEIQLGQLRPLLLEEGLVRGLLLPLSSYLYLLRHVTNPQEKEVHLSLSVGSPRPPHPSSTSII